VSVIARQDITGLVLAGGRGQRMGGLDKGLQTYRGQTLVQTALDRLAPQVGPLMISANRHLDDYARFGVPVLADTLPGHAGPLAGWLAALEHGHTPWLASVPCDTPGFPLDLVARLADAVQPGGLAVAATGANELHPVFCLMHRTLAEGLRSDVLAGQRRVQAWALQRGAAVVHFSDRAAFTNINTLAALHEA
jgi:molybdenum cofactor guanylyltransferase